MEHKKKSQQKYPRLRVFFSTAMLTFCLLLLGTGFLIADYNTRRVGFGDSSMRIDVTSQDGKIMLNLFGREKAVEVSDTVQKWAGRLWTMMPPEWRTMLWLFESECESVPGIWKLT